jgi:hypothetical protein
MFNQCKKIIGKILGYSACLHCGLPWNFVEHRTIMYSALGGMFPLCIKCFAKLPIEKIDYYIDSVIASWGSNENHKEFSRLAKIEARRMKKDGAKA